MKEWAVNAAQPFNGVPLQRRVTEVIAASGKLGEVLFGEHTAFFATCVEAV